MRDFKFRFWNKKKNKMLYWNYEEHGAGIGAYFNHPSIVPMQYTGLHDKNGKEIYEGDILSNSFGKENLLMNIVSFEHGSFVHKWIDRDVVRVRGKEQEPIFRNVNITFEVIGNIYEHHHLLGDSDSR
jgi:uncharacterized phage protein (TIGR01671 family)